MIASSPDAASCASGHLDVFAAGPDAALYHLAFKGASGWAQWERMGGQWSAGPGAVCLSGTSTVEVFERGPDAGLRWTNLSAG